MSTRPARRTLLEMIFAASARSYRIPESSPVASGCSRSCSMMKRSIVTTDVGVLYTTASDLPQTRVHRRAAGARRSRAHPPRTDYRDIRVAGWPKDIAMERADWPQTALNAAIRARATAGAWARLERGTPIGEA